MFKIMMNLLKINNVEIREYSIKILQLLFYVSEEFFQTFKAKGGFEMLGDIVINKTSAFNITTFSICQTILNSIVQTYDNPNEIRPLHNALASQVLNKSKIARDIVQQTKQALSKPPKAVFCYVEMFDFFFESLLAMNCDDNYRCQLLKMVY